MSDDLADGIGQNGSVAEIFAINPTERLAILSTGAVIQITDWFKINGHRCDPSDAVTCVAGPCSNGKWHKWIQKKMGKCQVSLNSYSKSPNLFISSLKLMQR